MKKIFIMEKTVSNCKIELFVFRCALATLYERVSVGRSVGPSVMLCNAFVENARKGFMSTILSLPFNALGLFMPF